MNIIADKNMPGLDETFGRHGIIHRVDGRSITRRDLRDADILLVRSVTGVNAELLDSTGIRFVGSATIGIDHLDTVWLEDNEVEWAHAPGCNADAAAQYALAMMWLACQRSGTDLRQQSVGIIGRGNVGGRLEKLLMALSIPVEACDPPLQDVGTTGLVSMQEVCKNSILSLHTPLTRSGPYPSENLFDSTRLAALTPGTLLVNTSRGAVINGAALLGQLQSGHIHAALDVWPDEPHIKSDLLEQVLVASPHIAGYSDEGKRAGTDMIYQAFLQAFSTPLKMVATAGKEIVLDCHPSQPADAIVQRLLQSSCPVVRDDAAVRGLPISVPEHDTGHASVHIDCLRSAYPERHEFKTHLFTGVAAESASLLRQLGCRTT